jgi:hypothetical protein
MVFSGTLLLLKSFFSDLIIFQFLYFPLLSVTCSDRQLFLLKPTHLKNKDYLGMQFFLQLLIFIQLTTARLGYVSNHMFFFTVHGSVVAVITLKSTAPT